MGLQSILLKIKNHTSVSRLINVLNISLLVFLIWLIGLAGARVVENEALLIPPRKVKFIPQTGGKNDKTLYFDYFKPIIEQNVFNAEVSSPQQKNADNPVVEAEIKNQLNDVLKNLQLTGVLHSKKTGGFCIIKNKPSRKEDIFTVNDEVFDTKLLITKIVADFNDPEVHLVLDGKTGVLKYEEKDLENLVFSKKKSSPSPKSLKSKYTNNGKDFRVSRGEVDSHLQDFSKLLTQARMSPYFKNGKNAGYQFRHIKKGSVFEKLGMQNRDIIKKVNGEKLQGAKLMELYRLLRHEKEFTLEVERGGAPVIFNYNIY